jgi:hypothetical protein
VLLLPEIPVGVDEEPVAVAEPPLPTPSDGESPEPEEATCPGLPAETWEEPALAAEDETEAEVVVEPEDDPVEVALAELEEAAEISLQDKS